MERLNIEIPVSVGDKVYRTTNRCEIEIGRVTDIKFIAEYYSDGNESHNRSEVKFTVTYGYGNNIVYKPEELGKTVFLTKKDLIKHIVGEI